MCVYNFYWYPASTERKKGRCCLLTGKDGGLAFRESEIQFVKIKKMIN